MNEQALSFPEAPGKVPSLEQGFTFGSSFSRRIMLRLLSGLTHGRLTLHENGTHHLFGEGPVEVHVTIHDARAWNALAFSGSVGAGESYMAGQWDCDDLVGLVRLLLRNRDTLDRIDRGWVRLAMPLRRVRHWLNRNSRVGSRRNIAAHYDVGNEFYRLWLDPTMMYSCAFYEREDMDLHQASIAKLDRICRVLDLQPEDHLLEIGTGWGGLALHAASRFGCRVTSVTVSQRQFELATRRIRQAGLADRVEIRLCDYRDLDGQYEKLVSVEMIEAVGAENLNTYFRQCGRLLKPDGVMFLQAITIADQRYEQALGEVDFIQKHIFPGGFLPSVQALSAAMTCASDLRMAWLDDVGPHYARTLADWRERFEAQLAAVRSLGFDDRFIRMWQFYFCYCEGGFHERDLAAVQMLLAKPKWRVMPPPGLS
ncbi:MAG: class I SAM-dependent methyltransferase [Betaproteobacteria bacterium]|nr:class I SAM-dependent methyltransferase [Betaproteobacteria bacterium]